MTKTLKIAAGSILWLSSMLLAGQQHNGIVAPSLGFIYDPSRDA
jgi:hypothetical protein